MNLPPKHHGYRPAPLPDPIVRYSQKQFGRLGRLECWTLHRTADLEVHLYGEVLSGSVADHVDRCLLVPNPYLRLEDQIPRPPSGRGGGSPRSRVWVIGPSPTGRRARPTGSQS